MLAIVVAVFATLWLPYRGMLVYNSFAILFSKEKFMDLWFLMFAKTCVFINSAINPILYNALSFKFRREFQKTLLCGKRRERWSGRGWGPPSSHPTSTSTLLRHSTPKCQASAAVGQRSRDCRKGRLGHDVAHQQMQPPTETETTIF
ncbi:thyrotropin-releasing hormone receptor-like [Ischnura elegans]|uniref:thyrotropin-releasing hormone receptor-like n=1 Tax=Ischnura elegans TaxID=197161 RepID=UPI001ED896BF|nr:thyrotropin-releasing hormone receptor-like [Ischnura elegans]